MATTLHSFSDIFNAEFADGSDIVKLKKIVIPIIQRDYAQGRMDPEVERIRNRFLESLYGAFTEEPITLDFVYGDIDEDGIMTPLDGQQRLTTLFLLHWYASKKECIEESECNFLSLFSYETRYSARDFCSFLIQYQPSFEQKLSKEIVNQAWFPLDWKKDPTIASMLVMIDTIDEKFHSMPDMWKRLMEGVITFYFLPIKDMGLTDELYIKMNSRGKPLTQFEHFKAELEHQLKKIDETTAKRIIRKIDIDWTEMLWPYRGENNVIDDEFLRYFKFVCDVICYKNGNSPQGKSSNEFDLLKEFFSKDSEEVSRNIDILEKYFDCWAALSEKETPANFFARFVSHVHEVGKIQIESRYKIDIFEDCLGNYSDVSGRRRIFPLNRIVFLYAVVVYLLNRESITDEQFSRRLRVINNLIMNSEDEISDSDSRASGNRMPAILAQVDSIMQNGTINETLENNFNPNQLKEESQKIVWVCDNPSEAEKLFKLEDHNLLQGQISIVGLENISFADRFADLFACDWDKVDCALMSTGFYPQKEQNGWRHQFGSRNNRNITAWRDLFHMSRNSGFNETHRILIALISAIVPVTTDTLEKVRLDYITECEQKGEYDFRYYYVKYAEFRPGSYGKYWNNYSSSCPYLYSVMQTASYVSENTYIPYLKIADADHLSREDKGQRLIYTDQYIECLNNAYIAKRITDHSIICRVDIPQNSEGIDTQDRIATLRSYISSISTTPVSIVEEEKEEING